jgi:glucosyl-dolichyl phosphate glucuronosyltransferase
LPTESSDAGFGKPDLSVIVCTYNRADMLPGALESILAQDCPVSWELFVVDNNSSDNTQEVIRQFQTRYPDRVRTAIERQQGVSYGRNRGIAETTGPILAFTDDDVLVQDGWLARIWRELENDPKISFVGGKVLPRWNAPLPHWMSRAQYSSVGLVDPGDEAFDIGRERPYFVTSANLGVRRTMLDVIGHFDPNIQRVKDSIGSIEDNELMLRAWLHGFRGRYLPELVVHADVQLNRMEKSYHRRWFRGNGLYCARARLTEFYGPNGEIYETPPKIQRFFGTPLYLYSDLLKRFATYLATLPKGEKERLGAEHNLSWSYNYILESYRMWAREQSRSHLSETAHLVRALLAKATGRTAAINN